MKVVIYARVSTEKQELEQQITACQRFCEYRRLEIVKVYSEIISGAKTKRLEYDKLIKELRRGLYDGVVVFRLDRLGRRARELALLVDELENKGIKVFSINENFDTSTAMGRAMRELIYIFAQLEREQISEATTQRLQALKNLGKKLGRKEILTTEQKQNITLLKAEGKSIRKISEILKIKRSTVHRVSQNSYPENQMSGNIRTPVMSDNSPI
jgi:DNA invertase Pin-like site-specific DNA recombinase